MSYVLIPYFISVADRPYTTSMKNILGICFLSVLLSMAIISCGDKGHDDPKTVVESFSTAYFNWRFKDAELCVTTQSRKWLAFAASQVDSDDVDSLRAMEFAASVEIEDINEIDDTTAQATVTVKNFLTLDSIGAHPHTEAERQFKIPVSLVGKYWKVKLTRLP